MKFRDILKNAVYTFITFSLVIAMALVARNSDIIVGKNDVEKDTVSPDYNVENVTDSVYEDRIETYLYSEFYDVSVWEGDYEDSKDNIAVQDEQDVWQQDFKEPVNERESQRWDDKKALTESVND